MSFAATVNGVRAVRVRLVTTWRGAWFADIDLDPESAPVTAADVPSGSVTIVLTPPGLAQITLVGTVDPDAVGRFVSSVPLRVLAGAGGWAKSVPEQQFHSDGGVSSVTVEQSTANAVGETVNDPSPVALGIDWVRLAGPARRVFGERDWYVDGAGVTQVGARPPATPDASIELLSWEPLHQHGMLSGDALVLPGTVLTDPRFDGPITVRDVVQTFDASGTRAEIWCGQSTTSKLEATLRNIVNELGGLATLKTYLYRIVSQNGDGRLVLQPVVNPDGSASDAPPLNPVSVWPGMSGLSALYKTSSQVIVGLVGGDPAFPVVVSFQPGVLPTEATLDASGVVHVGPSATVKLAENASDYGGSPMSTVGDSVVVMFPPACPVAGTITIAGVPSPFVATMAITQPAVGSIVSGKSRVLG